jgi:fumarate reductase flavoprotein subunit
MTADAPENPALKIGRRAFILAGAALGTIAGSAAWQRAMASEAGAWDVIVVGGGTAGMPLAIAAARRGALVLVVERSNLLGGSLDRSNCSLSAAGTELQAQAGISDDAHAHFEDVMRATDGVADPALVRLWTDHAAETVAWLARLGVKFRFKDSRPVPVTSPYRTPRVQIPVGLGKAVQASLQAALDPLVASGNIVLRTSSRVVELLLNRQGAVAGTVVQSADGGALESHLARSVVLTAGGCHGSPRLFRELHGFPLATAPGFPLASGDGIVLARSVGGFVRGAERYVPLFGVVMADDEQPSLILDGLLETTLSDDVPGRGPWEIWVNAAGRRFFAEDSTAPQARENALGEQPGKRMWTIHDHAAVEHGGPQMSGWSKERYLAQFGTSPMFQRAETLEILAVRSGLDPSSLIASVREYNAALRCGAPDPLGRKLRPAAIERGPFYCVRYQGWHLLTFAGLAVDGQLRVIRHDGSVVRNLYAAGEVLGATALGGSARATGSMCTPALTFGRLLGERLPSRRGHAHAPLEVQS